MEELAPICEGEYNADPAQKYRRRRIIAAMIGCFLLLFVVVFLVMGIRNSLQPFEGFLVYPKSKDNMIIYKMNGNLSKYVQSLNGILEEYNTRVGDTAVDCPGNTAPTNTDPVCRFNTSDLWAALPERFGYQEGTPTLILQLRPPVGWEPRVYTNDTDMSQWKLSEDLIPTDHVPVVCQGRYVEDEENLGELRIVPDKGIPIKYFPYRGQADYQFPLVAVQLLNPLVGVMIRLRCDLWDLGAALEDQAPLGVVIYLQVDTGAAAWPWPMG